MQIIDVLSDQREVFEPVFPFSEREVSRIRLDAVEHASSIIEPLPDELGIGGHEFRRRQFGNMFSAPGPYFGIATAAKRRHAALGGDSSSGEHGDASRAVED
jgi:hypothetical protein